MTRVYFLLGLIFVTVTIAMITSTMLIEFVLAPWWERRADLRKMIGKR